MNVTSHQCNMNVINFTDMARKISEYLKKRVRDKESDECG